MMEQKYFKGGGGKHTFGWGQTYVWIGANIHLDGGKNVLNVIK